MTERKDRIRVHVEGKEYNIVGGSFHEMLAAVKQINGRRFVTELKVWQLPGSVADIQNQLEITGYRLEGGTPVSADAAPANRASLAQTSGDRIRVLIEGHQLAVVGGSFQDMLATIKSLPGRRFDGQTKIWEIQGELAVIKGMIESAGFELEGTPKMPIGSVPSMATADFLTDSGPPPPFEPLDFTDDDDIPPFEPPDWMDDVPPPAFEDGFYAEEPMPLDEYPPVSGTETIGPAPTPAPNADRIRIQLGKMFFAVSGGSFQEMLTVVKNIPGRRFNPDQKVWEIPEDITVESIQQTVSAAGFVLSAD